MDTAWYELLKKKVFLLIPASGIRATLEQAFDPKYYDQWRSGLTHPAVNPKNDFEAREFLGDKILSAALAAFLGNEMNDLTAEQFTNANARLTNNAYLAVVFKRYQLQDVFMLPDSVDRNDPVITGDVMEALIGTIYHCVSLANFAAAFPAICYLTETIYGNRDLQKDSSRPLLTNLIAKMRMTSKDKKTTTIASLEQGEDGWKLFTSVQHFDVDGGKRTSPRPYLKEEPKLSLSGKGQAEDSYETIVSHLNDKKLRQIAKSERLSAPAQKYVDELDLDYDRVVILRSGTHSKTQVRDNKTSALYLYTVFGVKDGVYTSLYSDWSTDIGKENLLKRMK